MLYQIGAVLCMTGAANCAHFAHVELVAEQLARNLSDFQVHKIVTPPSEWNVSVTCFFLPLISPY